MNADTIPETRWPYIEANADSGTLDAIEEDEAAFLAYLDNFGGKETDLWDDVDYALETFLEAYEGIHDSEKDFAWVIAEDSGIIPEHLRPYFDIDKWARDLFISDYFSIPVPGHTLSVYVFRSM